MPRLTKSEIAKLKPKADRYFVWDNATRGLGIAVQPSGAMSWVYQYRIGKRTRRLTIGPVSSVLPKDAQDQATKFAAQVLKNKDPAEEKKIKREALTVRQLLRAYMASKVFTDKTTKTQDSDRGRIENHLIPLLGSHIANKVTAEIARNAHGKIAEGATSKERKTKARGVSKVRGGEGVANKCIALLKAAYSWAEEENLISVNKVRLVKTGADNERDYVLSNDDYAAAFRAIDDLVAEQELHPVTADLIRVLALTGARRSEIALLRWHHVNLKEGIIKLDEHKTKKKTGKARIIGLPTAAQEIISRQYQGDKDDLVFFTTSGKSISLEKPLRQIREKAGLPKEFIFHSFRHTLATNAAHNGATAHQIQALMGHKTLAMSSRYVHMAQDKRAQLAQQHAVGIASILNKESPGEVVKLEK